MNPETANAVIIMCHRIWAQCPWAAPAEWQEPSPLDELFRHFK